MTITLDLDFVSSRSYSILVCSRWIFLNYVAALPSVHTIFSNFLYFEGLKKKRKAQNKRRRRSHGGQIGTQGTMISKQMTTSLPSPSPSAHSLMTLIQISPCFLPPLGRLSFQHFMVMTRIRLQSSFLVSVTFVCFLWFICAVVFVLYETCSDLE